MSNVFDENRSGRQASIRRELQELLTEKECRAARTSTLIAFYTPPSVIKAIYGGLRQMGFEKGNILEPAMGAGNFFGLLPEDMSDSDLYGVELDKITGQIAGQLYQKAKIEVCGFEDSKVPDNFFDVAIGNVPFGGFKVFDKSYDKHNFLIHDYFFAKTLDKIRPGGVMAFITSKGTLDKANPAVRRYIAQRAELLGAIRLPNNAMLANAGTEVTSDIIFLQKRERLIDVEPDWIYTTENNDGIRLSQYFAENPHMILGTMGRGKSMYGGDDETTCTPFPDSDLEKDLNELVSKYIRGNVWQAEISKLDTPDERNEKSDVITADPNVRNYSYTIVGEDIYYRENSVMRRIAASAETAERIKKLVGLRDMARVVIDYQLNNHSDDVIQKSQQELSAAYNRFVNLYGCINDRTNAKVFDEDPGYYLIMRSGKFRQRGEIPLESRSLYKAHYPR